MEKLFLPVPERTLTRSYLKLIQDIEYHMGKLVDDRFKQKLKCRKGCDQCCISFSVLPIEAALISARLKNIENFEPDDFSRCQMLSHKSCTVYTIRPIICRTQGLPIAYVDESSGSIEVSACHLNFDDSYQFKQDELFFMDQFNQRLADINIQYCTFANIKPENRIALNELVANPPKS